MVDISFIICTYNREIYIEQCLNHLKDQSASADKFEIVIINNNCTDSTDLIVNNFITINPSLSIQYYIEKKAGLSYARNRGMQLAKGNVFCFIDDDGFVYPNYAKDLLYYIQTIPDLKVFGGKIIPKFEGTKPKWLSKYLMPLISALDLGTKVIYFKGTKYPIGANMGFIRKVAQEIGDFNVDLGRKENNLLGGEEKDYFLRIRKNMGYKIHYLPNCQIDHVIPEKRLSMDFIYKLALGIGQSEKKRSLSISKLEYLKSILKEFCKWGATLILSLKYLFQNGSKSTMLIRFRYRVSKGLFKVKP